MVEPAWAVADIATSGSKSEIVRRCFVNMVRLHHCWKRVMCASNDEFGANCLAVTVSRRREADLQSHYQRNSRGPNAAPASVHSTIVPPYQSATNGKESS